MLDEIYGRFLRDWELMKERGWEYCIERYTEYDLKSIIYLLGELKALKGE